jgi:hypothetical protein
MTRRSSVASSVATPQRQQMTEPGSTEAHMWHEAFTLVRGPSQPLGHCTHQVKRHPALDGPLASV